jgi:hypothetical protein
MSVRQCPRLYPLIVTQIVTQQTSQDPRLLLKDRTEELDAARATNRELTRSLNRATTVDLCRSRLSASYRRKFGEVSHFDIELIVRSGTTFARPGDKRSLAEPEFAVLGRGV